MIALNRPKRQFDVGQIVKHRRYGYRGVVVAFEHSCRAPDDWYRSNRTQPDKNQPWYHVLVHQSDTVTYAAQTSLAADDDATAIEHPLTAMFFTDFVNGRYIRNDRPWTS